MQIEKDFYKKRLARAEDMFKTSGISDDVSYKKLLAPPFEELQIKGESSFDYWMRTLNVVLDTNGTPEEIKGHPQKTYPAFRWSSIINSAYLAFWDAPDGADEFLITDIGMTSENEKGWDGVRIHNFMKTGFMLRAFEKALESNLPNKFICSLWQHWDEQCHFSENFMMFPISSKRMIVLISPFFKRKELYALLATPPELSSLSVLTNPNLFAPNNAIYKLPQVPYEVRYHEDDRYLYDIKKLSAEEIRYCNSLFLDRIDTHLGFSSLNSAVRSIVKYKKLNAAPYVPRVDYTPLYQVIEKRYLGNLNV